MFSGNEFSSARGGRGNVTVLQFVFPKRKRGREREREGERERERERERELINGKLGELPGDSRYSYRDGSTRRVRITEFLFYSLTKLAFGWRHRTAGARVIAAIVANAKDRRRSRLVGSLRGFSLLSEISACYTGLFHYARNQRDSSCEER